VATTRTDSTGRYSVVLSPGTYTLIVMTANVFPRCPATSVTVAVGAPTRADISCDTGIR